MRVLPVGLLEEIQRFDPTLDVFWNSRIYRWIVVQKLPGWHPVTSGLRGIPVITGERTHYKFLLCCELDPPGEKKVPAGRGIPVEPGNWIIKRLIEYAPQRQQEEDDDRLLRGGESMDDLIQRKQDEAADRHLEHVISHMGSELQIYGGVGNYSEEGTSRKHVVIDSSSTKDLD